MSMKFDIPDTSISVLPTHIAKLVSEAQSEKTFRIKVWASLELSEIIVKWVFAVAAAGVVSEEGRLTDSLANAVRTSIRRPTFGSWRAMTKEACDELRRLGKRGEPMGLPFADFFDRFSNKDGEQNSAWANLIDIRNNVIHGGGMSENTARKVFEKIRPILEPILNALAQVHQNFDTWATFDEDSFLLRGDEEIRKSPPSELPDGEGTWLVDREGRACALRPLLVYEPIQETWEISHLRSEERASRTLVPQSYFKFENDQLYYTPIGVDDFISINPDSTIFDHFFPQIPAREKENVLARQMREAHQAHLRDFVGRSREIDVIETWLDTRGAGGNLIGLVIGGPGLGKSALIAKCAARYRDKLIEIGAKHRRYVFHAFNAEIPYNGRRQFLVSIREQLEHWLGLTISKSEAIADANHLKADVNRLLADAVGPDKDKLLCIFIDGLDEIHSFDPKFLELLMELLRPGIVMVATSRNETFVDPFDASLLVERIPFSAAENELPGMSDNEIRGLLLQGLGRRARDIIMLDADNESGEGATNPYIQRVVERAAGKPLYIGLLIKDIAENKARIDPDARLPASMEGFYEQLLARQGLSDTKSHIAIILCLLALAKEPLSKTVLCDILSGLPSASVSRTQTTNWVNIALNQGDVFLARANTPDEENAYAIYHQELKRFILGHDGTGAEQLKWAFGLAKWLLVQMAVEKTHALETIARRHFARYGADYLLDFGNEIHPFALDVSGAKYVDENYLQPGRFGQALNAWGDDREAFLQSFARSLGELRDRADVSSTKEIVSRLFRFIFANRETHKITASIIQAVYSYSPFTIEIFELLLAEALSVASDTVPGSIEDIKESINWTIHAGGYDRRRGNLERATERLSLAERRLNELDDGGKGKERTRALLIYEQGYVAYSDSQRARTDELFQASVEAARLAGDLNGELIAENVRLHLAFVFAKAAGEETGQAIDRFERFLESTKVRFFKQMVDGTTEGDRLTAERWVMNCRAHLFDMAFERNDRALIEERYDEFSKDVWVQKTDPNRDTLKIRKPRFLYATGRLDEAIAGYRDVLRPIESAGSSDARREGYGQYYLEFARILKEAGKTDEAKSVLRSGLNMFDQMANGQWKPLLRQVLADLS